MAMCCSFWSWVLGGLIALGSIWLIGLIYRKTKRKPVTKPGVVLLHQLPRGYKTPNLSPFALKLETYLRLAKIPYEVDTTEPFGPKGKLPWITLDGEEMGDSTLIINFLNERFNVNLNKDLDEVTKGNHWGLQTMMEDHFFWVTVLHRFKSLDNFRSDIPLAFYELPLFYYLKYNYSRKSKAQGLGLHSASERLVLAKKDVTALSQVLGNKKFFGGQTPAVVDCVIFGFFAQLVFCSLGVEYETMIKEDQFKNIVDYTHRMKELIWPDWEKLLHKK